MVCGVKCKVALHCRSEISSPKFRKWLVLQFFIFMEVLTYHIVLNVKGNA